LIRATWSSIGIEARYRAAICWAKVFECRSEACFAVTRWCMIGGGATHHPSRMPGARTFENEPVITVLSGASARRGARAGPSKRSSPYASSSTRMVPVPSSAAATSRRRPDD